MILTLTPNPSIDATLALTGTLKRGEVQRPDTSRRSTGGKGINVSYTVFKAGGDTVALFPAHESDPFLSYCQLAGFPTHAIPVQARVRTNLTVTEPDGTTTKLNEPGGLLVADEVAAVEQALADFATGAEIIVLAGSLPPGAPIDWYATLTRIARKANPRARIAVDTSDAALLALAQHFPDSAPHVLKPNAWELGQLTGHDGAVLEEAASRGDYVPARQAAQPLLEAGVSEILLTLGVSGALLITADDTWAATPPPTTVISTVGAGDCALAGYLLGRAENKDDADCLRSAVAYGSAAASLPGTAIPYPDQIDCDRTIVDKLTALALLPPRLVTAMTSYTQMRRYLRKGENNGFENSEGGLARWPARPPRDCDR